MVEIVEEGAFLERVARRIGPIEEADVRRATAATLRALGQVCSPALGERIGSVLPKSWAALVQRGGRHPRRWSSAGLVRSVARALRCPEGRALEEVEAILATVGERLDAEAWAHARHELPEDVVALITRRSIALAEGAASPHHSLAAR